MPLKDLFKGSNKGPNPRASPTPSSVSHFTSSTNDVPRYYDQPPQVEKFVFLGSPAPPVPTIDPNYTPATSSEGQSSQSQQAYQVPGAYQDAPAAPYQTTKPTPSSPSLSTVPESSEPPGPNRQKRFGWIGLGSRPSVASPPATVSDEKQNNDNKDTDLEERTQPVIEDRPNDDASAKTDIQNPTIRVFDGTFLSSTPGPGRTDTDPDGMGMKRSQSDKAKRLKPLPPPSDVVEPFGGLISPGGTTPVRKRFEEPAAEATTPDTSREDVSKRPTCSLNLVCYSRGCTMSQIRVSTPSRFESYGAFQDAKAKNPRLITSDEKLFEAFRDRYLNEMCGFWRRYFSLKTLRRLRLLSYTEETRPTAVPMDEFTMQEVLYAYNHPSEFGVETDWIEWVFRLRQPDRRHALEFVEGWNGTRIAIVGAIPCVASTLVGLIWSARGGDVQTAFTVAGFILTVATVLLALLAVISGIDSKSH